MHYLCPGLIHYGSQLFFDEVQFFIVTMLISSFINIEPWRSQTFLLCYSQEISGVQDLEHCRAILERHGWNIESAVQDHLNSSDSPVSSRSPMVIPDALPTPSLSMTLAPPRGAGIWSWTCYVIMLPFRLCTWTLQLMIHYLFFTFARTNRRSESHLSSLLIS